MSDPNEVRLARFVVFCLEAYKRAEGISGSEAAERFSRYGVTDYLRAGYDVLHSFYLRVTQPPSVPNVPVGIVVHLPGVVEEHRLLPVSEALLLRAGKKALDVIACQRPVD